MPFRKTILSIWRPYYLWQHNLRKTEAILCLSNGMRRKKHENPNESCNLYKNIYWTLRVNVRNSKILANIGHLGQFRHYHYITINMTAWACEHYYHENFTNSFHHVVYSKDVYNGISYQDAHDIALKLVSFKIKKATKIINIFHRRLARNTIWNDCVLICHQLLGPFAGYIYIKH